MDDSDFMEVQMSFIRAHAKAVEWTKPSFDKDNIETTTKYLMGRVVLCLAGRHGRGMP